MESVAVITQQPMPAFSIGGVLSRTFSVIKKRFGLFFMLTFLPMLFTIIIIGIGIAIATSNKSSEQSGIDSLSISLFGIVLGIMLLMLVGCAIQGSFGYAAFHVLAGNRVTLGSALSRGLRRAFPLVLVGVITNIITSIGFMLLYVPGIIFTCFWFVVMPVCAVERLGVIASMGRSFDLTNGNRWRILGLGIVYGLVSFLVLLLPIMLIMPLAAASKSVSAIMSAYIVFWVVIVLIYMFYYTMISVAYHDLRVAKEGISSAALANIFD